MSKPIVVSIVALALFGAACGGPSGPSPIAASTAPPVSDTPLPAAAVFPVTVEHRLGTLQVAAPPERVVTIGSSDLVSAIALGVTPVAALTDPYDPSGISPWLQGKLDPAQTDLLPGEGDLPLEAIAAHHPDLILAAGHYFIDDDYPLLAQMAPTLADVNGPLADPWQFQTQLVGRALGREAQAAQLVADTEALIEAFRAEYPGANGKTFSLSIVYDHNAIATVYDEKDFAVQFFNELGLSVTPALAELARDDMVESATFSFEQIGLLEADLIILSFGSAELQEAYEDDPLFKQLEAAQDGRYLVVDLPTIAELRGPTVLGIPYILEQIRPGFERLSAERAP